METPSTRQIETNTPLPDINGEPEMQEHPDGTTTILLPDEGNKSRDNEWFDNLADTIPDNVLDELAIRYLDLIEKDIEARKERDKLQALGLQKSGVGQNAPGGADFEGASRVTHPILAEASIDFSSSAMKELFPPNGPVRVKVEGKPNKEKMDRAKRKAAYMNWQLTREIPTYRPELERLLTQLPFGGSQYMKWYSDDSRGRPEAEFIPIDDLILPYDARNFHDTQRKFHRQMVSQFKYEQRIASGMYRDLTLPASYAANINDDTESQKITAKIEGKEQTYQSDYTDRLIYEGIIYDTIEDDNKVPDNKSLPYLITIDEESGKVLALYRNWEEQDKNCREIESIVDFTFLPWRGALGIGLEHVIGGLSTALTGSLRALLDSALINNIASGLKLKGLPGGESLSVSGTQVGEVDSSGITDDIRKVFMPLPFNPPSPVLFQLLGWLDNAAKGVVSTAEEKIAEASNQMPVGTALALIEQGAKVFSAIHGRLHEAQRRCLEILHRINRDTLPEEKTYFGTDPEDYVTRQDFEGPMDVHPVSDPNIFSETQRFAQIQFVLQTVMACGQQLPQAVPLFDLRALFARAFELAKIPEYEEFLPEIPKAQPLNPADENVNLVMGRPVQAYPGQDHLGHIQVLLDFAQNPLLGMNPVIAPKFISNALNHLMDHLLNFYIELIKQDASQDQSPDEIDWDNDPKAATRMGKASAAANKAMDVAFQKLPALIQKAMQMMQAMAPKPPQDPMVAVAMQEVQSKHEIAKGELSIDQQKAKDEADNKRALAQAKLVEAQQKAEEADREYELELRKIGIDANVQIRTANIDAQTDLARTIHDNQSAQKIAEMKIASDEKTKLSTGASLEKE